MGLSCFVACSKQGYLVLALNPVKPQWIISGLKETFVKKYLTERTNKAEIRPKEQSEKAESCRENLWNEIVKRAIKTGIDTHTRTE